MKIMILVTDLPIQLNSVKGGVQSAVINLLEGLSKSGAIVRVLSFGRYPEREKILSFSETVSIIYCYEGKMPVHSLNYFFNSPRVIRRHIRQFKPDIIHYETGDAFLFTKFRGLLGTKNLLTLHGHALAEAKHKKKFSQKLNLYVNGVIEKILLPKNLIFISDYSRTEINIKNSIKQPTIYNAISSTYFELPLKQCFDCKLLFVGVISRRKNLMALLHAIRELKANNQQDFYLDIVGDFDDIRYKEEINEYIENNKLHSFITFHGWKSQQEVKVLLQEADVLVLPSLQETLPMVIAEAMAAGKNVIATKIGGIPEMIEHGINGYLYNPADIKELATILQTLFNNKETCMQVSKRAREAAKKMFHCESIACETLKVYDKIIMTESSRIKTNKRYHGQV